MKKQAVRWGVAWGLLAAAVIFLVSFGAHLRIGQAASVLVSIGVVLTLVLVRPMLSQASPDRRITVRFRGLDVFRKWSLPLGVVAIIFAITWVVIFSNSVPDSNIGIIILFGPSISLIVFGVSLIAVRFYLWFSGN